MGLRLRPLDPAADPTQRFACELRALRAACGNLPFWKMARRCAASKSALAAAVAGYALPSEKVTEEFVRACDGDWEWWRRRLHQAHAEQQTTGDDPAESDGATTTTSLVPIARAQPARANTTDITEHGPGDDDHAEPVRWLAPRRSRRRRMPRWTIPVLVLQG